MSKKQPVIEIWRYSHPLMVPVCEGKGLDHDGDNVYGPVQKSLPKTLKKVLR